MLRVAMPSFFAILFRSRARFRSLSEVFACVSLPWRSDHRCSCTRRQTFDDVVLRPEVDDLAFARNAFAIKDVEVGMP